MDWKSGEVVGFFYHQRELDRSVDELIAAGFNATNISTHIINPELERPVTILRKIQKSVSIETGAAGVGIGAALGSMLGFVLGSSYLDSRYFSVVVGAAVGAAFGGVSASFVGHKLPDENIDEFMHPLKSNGIQISVSTQDELQSQLAKFILAEFGATNIISEGKMIQSSRNNQYQSNHPSKNLD